jgi:phosphate transport system substrate-binding protein
MRYSNPSKVSLLSLTLLISSAGIVEVVNPYPTRAASINSVDSSPTLLMAQTTPQATPLATPNPVTTGTGNQEGGNGTLWWLLLLCLGLPFLLAWLGSKNKNIIVKPSTLILTPETDRTARVYWEIPPEKIQRLQRQGGTNLAVRLIDVTNINPQVTTPEVVQQVSCLLGSPLISVQVPEVDREYQAELGCVTNDDGWISLAKSAPAYFPAPRPLFGGLGVGIVTAIGSTAIGSFESEKKTPAAASPSQVVAQVVAKVEVVENPVNVINPTEAAEVIDDPAIPIKDARLIDNSINSSEDVGVVDSPVNSSEDAGMVDIPINPSEAVVDHQPVTTNVPTNDLEADVWNDSSAIDSSARDSTDSPVPDFRVNSNTEDPAGEEINVSISSVVPTVDDGGGGLNWGVGSTVRTAEVAVPPQPDEITLDTPLVGGETQIHLHIYTPDQGYVCWEIAPQDEQNLQSQGGGGLRLRIYDATDIDLDHVPAHDTQEYACDLNQSDRYVPIIVSDRPHADYIAELGYITNTGEWLRIIRSLHTRFFN